MKRIPLIALLLFCIQPLFADTKTSGRVILTLPTTGHIDVTKRIDVKFNENFTWISTGLNALDTAISTHATNYQNQIDTINSSLTIVRTDTGTLNNRVNGWENSISTISERITGSENFVSTATKLIDGYGVHISSIDAGTAIVKFSSITVYGTVTSSSGFVGQGSKIVNISSVANNTVGVNQMNISGTRNGTKYLRDDGVWNNPTSTSTVDVTAIGSNYIMNAEFLVNQRAFAGGALNNGVYGHDRWKANGNSNYTVSGSTMYLISGAIEQVIESPALDSKSVYFSVEDATAALTITITGGGAAGTITAGSGRNGCAFVINSTATGNITLKIAGTNASFKRPQLEIGTYSHEFKYVPYAQDLLNCKRYFERIVSGGTYTGWGIGGADSTTGGWIVIYYVTKRSIPTITTSGTFAAEMGGTVTSISFSETVKYGYSQASGNFGGTDFTVGHTVLPRSSNDATVYIQLDSEL